MKELQKVTSFSFDFWHVNVKSQLFTKNLFLVAGSHPITCVHVQCVFCYFCYFVQNGYKCNAAVQTVLMCDGVLTLFETSAVRRSWMMRFAGCCEQENLIYKSKWLSSTLGTPASQLSTSSSQSVRHSICSALVIPVGIFMCWVCDIHSFFFFFPLF